LTRAFVLNANCAFVSVVVILIHFPVCYGLPQVCFDSFRMGHRIHLSDFLICAFAWDGIRILAICRSWFRFTHLYGMQLRRISTLSLHFDSYVHIGYNFILLSPPEGNRFDSYIHIGCSLTKRGCSGQPAISIHTSVQDAMVASLT